MFDMFVGGVCSSGETAYETLLRELNEEIGLDFTTSSSQNVPENVHKNEGTEAGTVIVKKKNPYSDKIGSGKMFQNEEEFQSFMRSSNMTQKEKKNILISSSIQSVLALDATVSCGNSISYLGMTTIETSYNHCIVDCYAAICTAQFAESITFQDGEIEWGEWVTLDTLNSMLRDREKEFVPDGMQVWDALPSMIKK
jgi:NUDIX domain